MKKNYTPSHSSNITSSGSIRKTTFAQRKSDYVRSMHDRPAVFIEQSNKHNDFDTPSKNTKIKLININDDGELFNA